MTGPEALWISNRGEVSCARHGGSYLMFDVRDFPDATRIVTPLDVWDRATEADAAAWLDVWGTPLSCETCERQRAPKHVSPNGLGLPYAEAHVDADIGYHLVCPVCGWLCQPPARAQSEDDVTKGAAIAYADHFTDEERAGR